VSRSATKGDPPGTWQRFALAISLCVAGVPAVACPVCATGTGEAVRAGIASDFGLHLLATVAPFPILAVAVAALHWGWPPWRRHR
jgi:hypothetical protein